MQYRELGHFIHVSAAGHVLNGTTRARADRITITPGNGGCACTTGMGGPDAWSQWGSWYVGHSTGCAIASAERHPGEYVQQWRRRRPNLWHNLNHERVRKYHDGDDDALPSTIRNHEDFRDELRNHVDMHGDVQCSVRIWNTNDKPLRHRNDHVVVAVLVPKWFGANL